MQAARVRSGTSRTTKYREVGKTQGSQGWARAADFCNSAGSDSLSTNFSYHQSNKILIYSPKSLSDIAPKLVAKSHPEVTMTQRTQEPAPSDSLDDMFEPALELSEDDFEELVPVSTEKQRLAEKRRRAEQRLEQRRLREELGYYDLELEDF
jgi:hypothetical protein